MKSTSDQGRTERRWEHMEQEEWAESGNAGTMMRAHDDGRRKEMKCARCSRTAVIADVVAAEADVDGFDSSSAVSADCSCRLRVWWLRVLRAASSGSRRSSRTREER